MRIKKSEIMNKFFFLVLFRGIEFVFVYSRFVNRSTCNKGFIPLITDLPQSSGIYVAKL